MPEPFYPQTLNRYAYNNPIMIRDLDGHSGEWYDGGDLDWLFNSDSGSNNSSDNFWNWGSGGGSSSGGSGYYGSNNAPYYIFRNSPSVISTSSNSYRSNSTSSVSIGGGSGASMTSVIGGGGGYGGGTMYAANTYGNGTATDGSYGTGGNGNSNGSSLLFNGQNIYWFNDQGQPIRDYSAVSGPYGEGRLPEGIYTGDNLRVRNDNTAMMCPNGGWSLDLTPDFQTDRTLLRIHPDGNKPGTLGCIGVNCTASGQLYNDLRSYFKSGNSSIPVIVNYNLRVNLGENK